MAEQPKTAPYGFWTGLFDVKALFEKPAVPMYPRGLDGRIYWLESRAGEGGRVVLMQRDESGAERRLTPEGFSIRSRVHEYGGCSYTIHGHGCYFVNDDDQRVYIQDLDGGSPPEPVTPAGDGVDGRWRYIDLCVTPDGGWLVAVMERERAGAANENLLGAVKLEPGVIHCPQVLHRGHDFYANPVLDGARRRIAWFQWDHPDMPWDRSAAVVASYSVDAGAMILNHVECVIDEPETSVCQLAFDDDGDLLLAIDGESAPGGNGDFWNLFRYHDGAFTQLTFDQKEYGAPHWVFGDHRYVVLDDGILAVRTGPEGDELVMIDRNGGVERIESDAVDIGQLSRSGPNEALMMAAARDRSPSMTTWRHGRLGSVKGVKELLPDDAVSRPEAVRFPTGEAAAAHGYFYPPCNPHYRAPEGERPPLLVMAHGGPTARCSNALDLTRQYWTGIGFAVLDVNYRGSTGYGRAYRQALLGHWGRHDTEDIAAGVEYVAGSGRVDRHRVFIRGRSAGGYAVLSALTRYPGVFAAGACYYGIGNLGTLAQITHKFEGRYTDRLIGEAYDAERAAQPDSRFYRRSPIRFVSAIRCPVIVFQGLEDKVVPPDVSREIARALEDQGIDHEYVEYPGEGHGFRSSRANIDALERETAFFRRALDASGDGKAGALRRRRRDAGS